MEEEGIEETLQRDSSDVFAECLLNQVNSKDVWSMKVLQREMLSRFEKTNEMLINFNMLSSSRYNVTVEDFQKHTSMLYEMKKDLDSVFKRIRILKQRLSKTYPEAFTVCSDIYSLSERLNDEEPQPPVAVTSRPEAGLSKPVVGLSRPEAGTSRPVAGSPRPVARSSSEQSHVASSSGKTSKT